MNPNITILTIIFFFSTVTWPKTQDFAPPLELFTGFKAAPDPSLHSFQPLLSDPTHNFALGFLRHGPTQFSVSVVHSPSLEPLWQPGLFQISLSAQLAFNGSLVISDHATGAFWSTNTQGDRLVLLNTSNLQVLMTGSTAWQSFEFPGNTLVQGQNFTSVMSLTSSNGRYALKLGDLYFGMYLVSKPGSAQIYWKHGALQVKAQISPSLGPIYASVDPDGFFGMYQTHNPNRMPVDIQPFDSYQHSVPGIRFIRSETDGNLKSYYWDGFAWILDYQLIRNTCDLPNSCGPYGICLPAGGCTCVDNRTDYRAAGLCSGKSTGDFCGRNKGFRVIRATRVDLPYKGLMGFVKTGTLDECEGLCERNCSCWGAFYNNASGFCYTMDYPIGTMVRAGDSDKYGYFKTREVRGRVGFGYAIGILGGSIVILTGAIWFGIRILRRGAGKPVQDGVSLAGPYKSLVSKGSNVGSVELCNR